MKPKRILSFLGLFMLIIACGPSTSQNETGESTEETSEPVGMVGEEITYSADSTTMNGYIAYDGDLKGKRPGILVVHEWWGHNEYVRERADMLAELGYVALAVDMYGDGQVADHPDDAGKFAGMVMSNIDEARARFEAAMGALKSNDEVDDTQIAAIGYCFGGSVALTMANAGYDLDAVAAFHSGVQLPIPPSSDLKAKVLVANGADDPFIPKEQEENFKAAMDSVGADYEYISYPGAVHSFTSKYADEMADKFDMPVAYNEAADKASWKELQDLLNSVFNK